MILRLVALFMFVLQEDIIVTCNFFPAGMLINIECRAWAHNIVYDRHEGMGSVHIEIMIE